MYMTQTGGKKLLLTNNVLDMFLRPKFCTHMINECMILELDLA